MMREEKRRVGERHRLPFNLLIRQFSLKEVLNMELFTYYGSVPDKNGYPIAVPILTGLTREQFRRIVHLDPITREIC